MGSPLHHKCQALAAVLLTMSGAQWCDARRIFTLISHDGFGDDIFLQPCRAGIGLVNLFY